MELNESEGTAQPNLWDSMKTVVKGKLIAVSMSMKKMERSYISSLTTHLKSLEQKEEHTPKRRRQQEIIKLRTEIKKQRELYKESIKLEAHSLRKSTR